MLDFLGGMFVTEPPCKSLAIYHINRNKAFTPGLRTKFYPSVLSLEYYGLMEPLGPVHNEDGIQVCDLVAALRRFSPKVLSTWRREVEELADKVANGHWVDDIWQVPAAPTFIILLDNEALRNEDARTCHIIRAAQLAASDWRAERQTAWGVPRDLIELAKTTTVRHQVNWDI
ncbi:hypothetical protein BDV95DRAFT_591295 [Massariosphaeria phaeospora]|uniref:Uncharacterized protein n=1 Tax=Massariosphaeria phaeospora TaxID=100035 RepID=A0A7C8IGL4_9PLEO|nr:hypothetical protein BDV95DRAFT_591295 [Massariosphaeria phaeospora]